jgi:hypothetical protein
MKVRFGLATLGALVGFVVSALIPGLSDERIGVIVAYHCMPVILGAAIGEFFCWALRG